MKITLVRHAEVIEEYQGKYNGHIDIPLSDKGKKQAIELAIKLKEENFDKIYCSDLLRARETLEAFSYKTEPIFTEFLREKSWGKHEGKSFEEIQTEGIEYKNFEQWITSLDGENINNYQDKIQKYFYETIFEQNSENILIVTHSGVIKTLIRIIKNISLEKAFNINISYASCILFDTSDMKFSPL
jgi:alpha-ribazole phosphatase/probable phosphoglycerate mutase